MYLTVLRSPALTTTTRAAIRSPGFTRRSTLRLPPKWRNNSQQSLHRRHFSQIWLSQASLVQRAQIREDSSPQMLQVNGMGSTNGLRTGFRQTEVFHFPFIDQIFNSTGYIFNRNRRINPVLVKQIDRFYI